ncbi:hypothetical protein, partial [Photorhabdus sp. RM323S]|uniref:hypothetical protein n=1 Tax=Photorhabdus sp. RM323S TaxID=3342828 RepID=UPI0036D92ACB
PIKPGSGRKSGRKPGYDLGGKVSYNRQSARRDELIGSLTGWENAAEKKAAKSRGKVRSTV